MNKIQKKILSIYKEYFRICKKYNLKFYAIGGTAIGAIRHKGFIPWDDDLDVAMPIDDYNFFRKVASKELSSKYSLIDYSKRGCRYFFLKIQDNDTTYIEESEKYSKRLFKGVFIDIMPISYCLNNDNIINKYTKKLSLISLLNNEINCPIQEKNKMSSKVKWISFNFFFLPFGKSIFGKIYNHHISKYRMSDKNKAILPSRFPLFGNYKGVFDYDDFCNPIFVKFEDTIMSISKNCDKYLKKDFGNYLELPPIEKRVPCHNTVKIDLKKSFKKYSPSDFK